MVTGHGRFPSDFPRNNQKHRNRGALDLASSDPTLYLVRWIYSFEESAHLGTVRNTGRVNGVGCSMLVVFGLVVFPTELERTASTKTNAVSEVLHVTRRLTTRVCFYSFPNSSECEVAGVCGCRMPRHKLQGLARRTKRYHQQHRTACLYVTSDCPLLFCLHHLLLNEV